MKLKTKLLIPVFVCVLLLAFGLSGLYFYFLGGMVFDQFEKNGRSVATSLSISGRMGVMLKDSSQLNRISETAFSDENVRFVSFYDERGEWITSVGTVTEARSASTLAASRKEQTLEVENKDYGTEEMFSVPVFARGVGSDIIGMTVVGISKEQLHEARSSVMLSALAATLVLLAVLFVGINVIVDRLIVRPVNMVITTVKNADLNSDFHTDRSDEMGDLMKSFDVFVHFINETLHNVSDASASVAGASSEIKTATESMADGSQEQSMQTTEVAAAVNEMTKTLEENGRNITSAAAAARKAGEEAHEGGVMVERTIEGMRRIADVVTQSASHVKVLGDSSERIGEIVGVINDIADQTNLLALNAAIEAARAGEQGRGFAVVADEVRKLAERTSKATKEIAGMINKIQADTKHAVKSMQQGTTEVGSGIGLAEQAGAMLSNIVTNAASVSEMINQVSVTSNEQTITANQVSQNIETINGVTQEHVKGSKHIADTAEELHRLTDTLQGLLAKFNLRDRTGAQAPSALSASSAQQRSRKAVTEEGYLVDH